MGGSCEGYYIIQREGEREGNRLLVSRTGPGGPGAGPAKHVVRRDRLTTKASGQRTQFNLQVRSPGPPRPLAKSPEPRGRVEAEDERVVDGGITRVGGSDSFPEM